MKSTAGFPDDEEMRREARRQFSPSDDGGPPPKYVEELQTLCGSAGIPCRLDRGSRRVTLTLPASAGDRPRTLTSVVANIHNHTDWSVNY